MQSGKSARQAEYQQAGYRDEQRAGTVGKGQIQLPLRIESRKGAAIKPLRRFEPLLPKSSGFISKLILRAWSPGQQLAPPASLAGQIATGWNARKHRLCERLLLPVKHHRRARLTLDGNQEPPFQKFLTAHFF